MSSQQFHNTGSSIDSTTTPRLCDKGCGFYGSSMATSNLWLCSQCYRKHCKTQPPPPPRIVDFGKLSINESSSSCTDVSSTSGDQCKGSTEENRCSSCRKRIGLTGFKCRCGNTFCSMHRYAEEHDCTFDYKGTARNDLSKANPCVKADKLQRI